MICWRYAEERPKENMTRNCKTNKCKWNIYLLYTKRIYSSFFCHIFTCCYAIHKRISCLVFKRWNRQRFYQEVLVSKVSYIKADPNVTHGLDKLSLAFFKPFVFAIFYWCYGFPNWIVILCWGRYTNTITTIYRIWSHWIFGGV
jgi:hypothetical protein